MDLLAYIRHSLVSANNCPALSKLICRTKTDTRPVQRVSATQNNRTMDTRTPSQRCNPMHARSNVHFFKQTPKRQGFTLQCRPRIHDIQSIRGVELLVGKSLFWLCVRGLDLVARFCWAISFCLLWKETTQGAHWFSPSGRALAPTYHQARGPRLLPGSSFEGMGNHGFYWFFGFFWRFFGQKTEN